MLGNLRGHTFFSSTRIITSPWSGTRGHLLNIRLQIQPRRRHSSPLLRRHRCSVHSSSVCFSTTAAPATNISAMTIHRQSSPTNSVCPINGTPVPDTSDLSHPTTVNHKLHYSYPSHQPTPVSAAPVPNDSRYDVPVALRKVPPPPPNPTKTHLGKDVAKLERMSNAVTTLLECLGEDPSREGLRNTPMRYAKALLALTHGYGQTAEEVVAGATFDEDHEEPVLVRDITLNSLCEHHILPFQGVCHISYIPRGRVLGLSKFARIVDVFSKRLQVQERLTKQIADAVERVTGAAGVMVMVSCSHECMSMRGVQRVGAVTTTTATRGRYGDEAALRQEFLSMVGARAS